MAPDEGGDVGAGAGVRDVGRRRVVGSHAAEVPHVVHVRIRRAHLLRGVAGRRELGASARGAERRQRGAAEPDVRHVQRVPRLRHGRAVRQLAHLHLAGRQPHAQRGVRLVRRRPLALPAPDGPARRLHDDVPQPVPRQMGVEPARGLAPPLAHLPRAPRLLRGRRLALPARKAADEHRGLRALARVRQPGPAAHHGRRQDVCELPALQRGRRAVRVGHGGPLQDPLRLRERHRRPRRDAEDDLHPLRLLARRVPLHAP